MFVLVRLIFHTIMWKDKRYQEGISVERHRGIYLQEKLEGCSVDRGMQISGGFLISCRPRLNAA